jgi:hypothetical protein
MVGLGVVKRGLGVWSEWNRIKAVLGDSVNVVPVGDFWMVVL